MKLSLTIMLAMGLSYPHLVARMPYSIYIVARTIYLEAGGESDDGKLAVASVIYNRANGDVDKLVEVCLKPRQFSCWNGGIKDKKIFNRLDRRAFRRCVKISEDMHGGKFIATTNANHYYNPRFASPEWGKKMKNVIIIGNHKFGEL